MTDNEKLRCNHCGNNELFYVKERYRGSYDLYIDSEGFPDESGYNIGIYDNPYVYKTSKYVYCSKCNKRVCEYEKFIDKRKESIY